MVWYKELLKAAIFGKYHVFHCDVEADGFLEQALQKHKTEMNISTLF